MSDNLKKDMEDWDRERSKVGWDEYWVAIKLALIISGVVGLKHLGHYLFQ